MQNQHQIIRPGHIDMLTAAFVNQTWQLNVDFGIDRFRWQKQNRAFGCFPRNDIFVGNIIDMLFDIGLQPATCRITALVIRGIDKPPIAF